MSLQFASPILKDNSEVVLLVVTNSEMSQQFASENLKDDSEIFLEALKNRWNLQNESEKRNKRKLEPRGFRNTTSEPILT